jgi:CRISPR type IV-associated protein Csf1
MCKQGVFKSAANTDIAYWITNPPEGHWIWIMGMQQRQHMVWKATVNTSQDVFQVLYDETPMTIRRKKVFDAVDASRRLAAAASVGRRGAPLKIPFNRLSRDLDDASHGSIRRDLHNMAVTDPEIRADIKVIQSCTPGEIWALTALMYAQPEDKPTQYFPKSK